MEDKKLLKNEDLEKVTGGILGLTGGEANSSIADNPIFEGDIFESRDWCCKNGHYFTVEDAYRYEKLCPVCNEKLELTDHLSFCLPNAVNKI